MNRALLAPMMVAWLSGCGGGEKTATNAVPPDAKRVDESKAGRIAGRVAFAGQLPSSPAITGPIDAVCSREIQDGQTPDTFVAHDGGLENVFVYVKDGLGKYYFDRPSEKVKVDQKGCRYVPHVFGVRTGQPIEFGNSDPTVHNVHAMGDVNQGFNFTQKLAGMRDTRTFTAREVMVRMKCDVHPWMTAYVGVLDHPYFAVTSDGGKFELKNVPAGTYTIEAWHEKLGTHTMQVTLGEKESKEITFTFQSSEFRVSPIHHAVSS